MKRIEYVRYRNWSYPYLGGENDPELIKDKTSFFAEESEEFYDIKPEHRLYNGWWIFRNHTDRVRWIEDTPIRRSR